MSQLNEFKQAMQEDMKQVQNQTYMALDNKADTLEINQLLDMKADAKAVEENCVDRNKVDELELEVT